MGAPRLFGRLIRKDGAVVIPANLARSILVALTLGLSELRRRDQLGKLSDEAIEVLKDLYELAQGPEVSVNGREPAAERSMESPQGTRLLTADAAARLLECSDRSIRRACEQGRIRGAVKAGRQWLIDPEALDDFRFGPKGSAA